MLCNLKELQATKTSLTLTLTHTTVDHSPRLYVYIQQAKKHPELIGVVIRKLSSAKEL